MKLECCISISSYFKVYLEIVEKLSSAFEPVFEILLSGLLALLWTLLLRLCQLDSLRIIQQYAFFLDVGEKVLPPGERPVDLFEVMHNQGQSRLDRTAMADEG